jgi:hypothetical protein
MDALHTLFGSELRVKVIRLFLFNPEVGFDARSLAERAQGSLGAVKKEISLLLKSGLIKKKAIFSAEAKKKKKYVPGFTLDSSFPYLDPLHTFLLETTRVSERRMLSSMARIGKIKLVVVAGVFMKQWDSRVDLLIVGDEVQEKALMKMLKSIESDLGREIRFTLLQTVDFKYRISVYDRLLRDVLDYPHKILLDKIGVTLPKPTRLLSTVGEGAT